MNAVAGMEARYMGQRVKVLAVRFVGNFHRAEVIYLTGSFAGSEVTVDETELEPLGATARPSFQAPHQVAL